MMYHHFVHMYNQIFPFDSKMSDHLTPFIIKDGKAIDLGCGTGRMVQLLDALQMKSSGVDIDEHMIKKAQTDFPNLEFYNQSMVDYLKESDTYDLLLCLGNTLPHLNEEELDMFFSLIKKKLTKRGTCIIQMLNYDKILKDKPETLKPIIFKDIKFYRHYTYFDNTITFKTQLWVNDELSEGSTTLYPYRRKDLVKVLDKYRFSYQFLSSLGSKEDDINESHLTLIITH